MLTIIEQSLGFWKRGMWFLVFLFATQWVRAQVVDPPATIQVNQEGFYPNAHKTAYIFTFKELEELFPPTGSLFVPYRMAVIKTDTLTNEKTEVYSNPWQDMDEFLEHYVSRLERDKWLSNHPDFPPGSGNISKIMGWGNPSGRWMYEWNFSELTENDPNALYHVEFQRGHVGYAETLYQSKPFFIHDGLMKAKYRELANAAFKYFYIHRIGEDIDPGIVSAESFASSQIAHPAFHGDGVPCYQDWCGNNNPDDGGESVGEGTAWADAADFGLYPLNHALAAWTLLNLVEMAGSKASVVDAEITHGVSGPYVRNEAGNQFTYNILSEVEVGSDWMRNLAPASGKLYPHKIHNHHFGSAADWTPAKELAVQPAFLGTGAIITPEEITSDTEALYNYRSATVPSTAATLAVCRTGAHLARVMSGFEDKSQVARNIWLEVASDAYEAAVNNPETYYPSSYKDNREEVLFMGGGPYADFVSLNENGEVAGGTLEDDFFSCLTELYLASFVMNGSFSQTTLSYRTALMNNSVYRRMVDAKIADLSEDYSYSDVTQLGIMSLLAVENNLPVFDTERLKLQLYEAAWSIHTKLEPDTRIYTPGGASQTQIVSDMPRFPHVWTKENIWWWASNANGLAHGIILANAINSMPTFDTAALDALEYAEEVSEVDLAKSGLRIMDYILGTNSNGISYVTGFGDYMELTTHDRLAYALKRDQGIPFPRGWLSGGPQNDWVSCYSGGELNWSGSPSYEVDTKFWQGLVNPGPRLGAHEAHTIYGLRGPEIIDNGPNHTGLYRYTYNPGSPDVDNEGDIVAKYLSERAANNVVPLRLYDHEIDTLHYPLAPEETYPGRDKGPSAWCTKENAINYNANLVYMALVSAEVFSELVEGADVQANVIHVETPPQNIWNGGYCSNVVVSNLTGEWLDWSQEVETNGVIYDSWNIEVDNNGSGKYTIGGSGDYSNLLAPYSSTSGTKDMGYCVYTDSSGSSGSPTPGSGGLTCSVTSEDNWSMYTYRATITNSGANNITGWKINFEFDAAVSGNEIVHSWNMHGASTNGSHIAGADKGYNASIVPGASISDIGLQVSKNGGRALLGCTATPN